MSKTTRYLLPTGWKGTGGLGKLAETIDRICSMINGINVVQGGDVFVDKDRIEFRVRGGGGGAFNGQAYTPAGAFYEDLTDAEKPWLKYDLSTGAITEEVGPPSDPWPANESWRKKGDFKGAIYF